MFNKTEAFEKKATLIKKGTPLPAPAKAPRLNEIRGLQEEVRLRLAASNPREARRRARVMLGLV